MCAVNAVPGAEGPGRERDARSFPGSGWTATSPPVAFPVYGLDASWPGARWLDGFGDAIGDPPRWVALAHQAVDGRSLIMVNTYSRPPTDAKAARWGQSPLQEIAFDAAHTLINVTLPALSVARPDGYIPLLVEQATEVAGQCAQWPAGPEGLSLRRFPDGSAYHFDLAGPLSPRTMSASRQAAGVPFEAPAWESQTWHADQLRLMRELRMP
jgi:hypothetical protein